MSQLTKTESVTPDQQLATRKSKPAIRNPEHMTRNSEPETYMKSYKDLEIYNLSYNLAIKVHKMSLDLPQFELYEEGGQLRRSTKGITSCIVEGYGRRRYKAEFVKFLVYAHASCDETILHLNFIKSTHRLDETEIDLFIDSYDQLGGKINKFIQFVEDRWNDTLSKKPKLKFEPDSSDSGGITRDAKVVPRNSIIP